MKKNAIASKMEFTRTLFGPRMRFAQKMFQRKIMWLLSAKITENQCGIMWVLVFYVSFHHGLKSFKDNKIIFTYFVK